MTCEGSFGTLMPQSKVVREIERSLSPDLTNEITSLRRSAGPMKSGLVFIVRQQLVLILGKLEEVARLFDPFDRRALRAVAHAVGAQFGLVLLIVSLVANRVPARIESL